MGNGGYITVYYTRLYKYIAMVYYTNISGKNQKIKIKKFFKKLIDKLKKVCYSIIVQRTKTNNKNFWRKIK